MARPKTPLLSRRGIAEAALELIDAEGLDGLSMRRLARRLGVEGASLYHHIASRDELLDEITAVIDERLEVPPVEDGDWRAALAGFARSYRSAFAPHPEVIAPIMRRPVRTREALRGYDGAFGILLGAGWGGAEASAILAAIDYLVLGSAIETFAAGFDRPPEEYAAEYPHLSRALEEADHDSLDDRGFELGLTTLIAGLRAPRRGRVGP